MITDTDIDMMRDVYMTRQQREAFDRIVMAATHYTHPQPVTPAGGEVGYSEKFPTTGGWPRYPIGTRAHAIGGGYWLRVKDGWEWPGGSTFPTPGGDALSVSVPTNPPVADSALRDAFCEEQYEAFARFKDAALNPRVDHSQGE